MNDLPPDLQVELDQIRRQQALSNAMIQRGSTMPGTTMVGRRAIPMSPLQGLGQMAQVLAGSYIGDQADKGYKGLSKRYNEGLAEAVRKYNETYHGTPGQMVESPAGPDHEGVQMPPTEQGGVAADPNKAIRDAIVSPYGPVRKLGEMGYTRQGKQEDIKLQRELIMKQREFDIEKTHQNRMEELELKIKEGRTTKEEADQRRADLMRELQEMRNKHAQQMKQLGLAVTSAVQKSSPVSVTTIQDPNDPNKTIVVDARRYKPGSQEGVIGAGPKLTETGKVDFKQRVQMQGFEDTLQQAEDLLRGVKRVDGQPVQGSKPTSSLIGKGVDWLGSVVGYAPEGKDEAEALKVVAGQLISKVPRFEGPQSDKDTQLYREMAGKAGDESQPLSSRLAAVRKMRDIYSGYAQGIRGRVLDAPGAPQQPGGTPPAGRPGTPPPPPGFQVTQ